ncbi:FYVE and coiled-coil domain-containing protein 1-like [Notothenia coriiceps]|uniref:FYVE and coiled-coil domain-containing protein 1-like n=1 Tax=Notothenia coriiceps TaxID=8208 RepID=A0A6I9MXU6_9TELE|nr:PREDICTED: FYVE and coiled-coil domain-containing protein 1-like [Notothenia coriiceps]
MACPSQALYDISGFGEGSRELFIKSAVTQAHEFPSSPDYGQNLLNDLNESCTEEASTAEDLRLELDQSELKQRGLLDKVQQLGEEAAELRDVVVQLQSQLDVSLAAQEEQQGLQGDLNALQGKEEALSREVKALRTGGKAEQQLLQEKLAAAEGKNMELLAKLDGVLSEKGQQATSHFDSAQKIHELLDRLKEAERGKMDAVAEADEKKRQAERLEEELTLKEAAATRGETKLEALVTSASEEKAKWEVKVEEQCSALDKLQGALTVREKETRSEVTALKGKLKEKDAQLGSKHQSLITERDKLTRNLVELEGNAKEQAAKVEEYKTQCGNLIELNKKMLKTEKRNEGMKKEMLENRKVTETELAALRASEKQLRGQMDDTKMTVDEKEKHLREENRQLDESLQRANMAAKHLEQENQSVREEQDTVKAALSRMQADLKSVHAQIGGLEKNLGVSRKNETTLQEQLGAKEQQLEHKEKSLVELQSSFESLETREKELEIAKSDAEATCAKQTEMIERVTSEKRVMETSQLERSAVQVKENQEETGKLEGQLEVCMKDVSRLQAETLDLRVRGQRSEEEKVKSQAQLEVTEAQRDELRALTEHLKAQTEALNQKHVAELVDCKKKEGVLIEQRDKEIAAAAELSISAAAVREQLSERKAENSRLSSENGEIREGLHRANTEMAELGITICKLGAEKEEAREHWAGDAARIQEMEKEVERLEESMAEMQRENARLREELTEKEKLPESITELKKQLDNANNQMQSAKEEVEAAKFHLSSESMSHQVQMKVSRSEVSQQALCH